MKYINEKGKKAEPYMIHRALLGSLERFFGVLIEYYGGAFPLWLSPVQIQIIPISSRHSKYANSVLKELSSFSSFQPNKKGAKLLERSLAPFSPLRVQLKDENETISKKIRQGEIQKIPYILVVGDQEMKNKTVRVRERSKGDIGEMKLDKFIKLCLKSLKPPKN